MTHAAQQVCVKYDLNSKILTLTSAHIVGIGGEATVYQNPLNPQQVVKIYKQPNHPDFAADPPLQAAAKERLSTLQTKLLAFPTNLPYQIIAPDNHHLVRDAGTSASLIVGYAMPFIKDAEVLARLKASPALPHTFRQLAQILQEFHQHPSKPILGDYNDYNTLIDQTGNPFIIDVDSMQFGTYLTRMYTERFVDPLLCDPNSNRPILTKPYNQAADWYAFSVMLMQSLLGVGPFDGRYVPSNLNNKIPEPQRPLKRVTIFNNEVRYPKFATPIKALPDDLLHYFHNTFEQDRREIPNLSTLIYNTCPQCGQTHYRPTCPFCTQPAVVIPSQQKFIFKTKGEILYATVQDHKLYYVYYEAGKVYREGQRPIFQSTDPNIISRLRFAICGERTAIQNHNQLLLHSPTSTQLVHINSGLDKFGANSTNIYWLDDTSITTTTTITTITTITTTTPLGQVLPNAQFWVGPIYSFGCYRGEGITVGFEFNSEDPGVSDSIAIPPIRGRLLDSAAYFSDNGWCWFLTKTASGSQSSILNQFGQVRPGPTPTPTQIQGCMATHTKLFYPSNGEIRALDIIPSDVVILDQHVDEHSKLLRAPGGAFIVNEKEIYLVTNSQLF